MTSQKLTEGSMPSAKAALPGRDRPITIVNRHAVLNTPLQPPYPQGSEQLVLGMGCFWGAEKVFWSLTGTITTAVGYSGGYTPNPSYEEVCSGMTGHSEVVLIAFDPAILSTKAVLAAFWQSHDPTQGMRQGNDRGTQYRSGIYYYSDGQKILAEKTRTHYQAAINKKSGTDTRHITTEIQPAAEFYFAEDYHQQYLAKHPNGYCGLGGLGVRFG